MQSAQPKEQSKSMMQKFLDSDLRQILQQLLDMAIEDGKTKVKWPRCRKLVCVDLHRRRGSNERELLIEPLNDEE